MTLSNLELRLDVGNQQSSTRQPKGNLHDSLTRDLARQFLKYEKLLFGGSSKSCEEFALATCSGNIRFAEQVKSYLTTKFELGTTTGNKLTLKEFAQGMHCARTKKGKGAFQGKSD